MAATSTYFSDIFRKTSQDWVRSLNLSGHFHVHRMTAKYVRSSPLYGICHIEQSSLAIHQGGLHRSQFDPEIVSALLVVNRVGDFGFALGLKNLS